jgi:hypothetical protein
MRVVFPQSALELVRSQLASRGSECMAALRPESFQLALQTLRVQLHDGVFAPGTRITASEVAASLHLSPTPVSTETPQRFAISAYRVPQDRECRGP